MVTAESHWWLGFIDPKWSFPPNVKAPIRLRLDAGAQFDRLATVPNGQLLLVSLPDSSRLIDAFRHSSELAVNLAGRSFHFRLNETPAIMDRLTSCVRSALAGQDKVPSSENLTATAAAPASEGALGQPPARAGVSGLGNSAPGQPTQSSPLSPSAAAAATAKRPPAAAKTVMSSAAADTGSSAGTGDTTPATTGPSSVAPETAALPSAADASPSAVPAHAGAPGGSASPALIEGDALASATTKQSTLATTAPVLSSPASGGRRGPLSDAQSGDAAPAVADASNPAPHRPDRAPGSASTPTAASPAEGAQSAATASPAGGDASAENWAQSPNTADAASPASGSTAGAPEATGQPPPVSGSPHIAFTALTPAPLASIPATAVEEVRLASDFLVKAQLRQAHLVAADKPAALADFAAVWRGEDAAGAVKIIPAAPEVSAVGIAPNLISVDPQMCKGDFAAARYRTAVGNSAVFSAVLSCSEAGERRVTEYIIAPRHQGGFVVFAVIRSLGVGEIPDFDRHKLDELSRAAIQAADGKS